MSKFNPLAKTPEEHIENCRFQLENVEGYLMMANDDRQPPHAAWSKAKCLLDAAQKLVGSLEKQII